MSAAVLMVGSLVVVSAQPASAFRYFVHGNVHCTVASGHVDYAPSLRETISAETRMRIKGTFTCDVGETGVPNTVVTGGKFKMLSNPFSGTCSSGQSDTYEMTIQWFHNPEGQKIRNSEISWVWNDAADSWTPGADPNAPYAYHFVGSSSTSLFGLSGSYVGAIASANFVSGDGSASNPGTFASLACHRLDGLPGRLRGGWNLDPSLSDFTIESAPYVNTDGVNPNNAPIGTQNLDVDITGAGFNAGDSVAFSGSGITVNSSTVNSPTDITANISIDPGAAAGTRDVTVSDSAFTWQNTCSSCFMVSPIVSSLSPATAGQGASSRSITITGQGFANGAITQFGPGSGITTNYTQFIDSNTLIANINVAPAAPLTTYDVTVTDPGYGVGTCTACFSVNSGPTVTSTSPNPRGVGATNQAIAINGTGFDPGSTVTFGGSGISVDAVSYVNSSQLTATVDIAPGTLNGNRSVTVLNSDGGQGGCAVCFTVSKAPAPVDWTVLTGLPYIQKNLGTDKHGRHNRAVWELDVQITGTNLQPNATIDYATDDVTVVSTTYMSTSRIKQHIYIDVLDYYANALPQDRAVTVTNPDGGTYTLEGAVVLLV
jgi:hypothetical protein